MMTENHRSKSQSDRTPRTLLQYCATRTFYLLLISFPIKEREPPNDTAKQAEPCRFGRFWKHWTWWTVNYHLLCTVLPGPKGTLTAFPGPQWIHARASQRLDRWPPLSSNVRCRRWTRRDQTLWKHVPTSLALREIEQKNSWNRLIWRKIGTSNMPLPSRYGSSLLS